VARITKAEVLAVENSVFAFAFSESDQTEKLDREMALERREEVKMLEPGMWTESESHEMISGVRRD
jgi:hypothetical protein